MYSRFKDAIGQLVISSHLDKIDDILKKVYDTPLKVDKDTFKITKLDEKELAEFNEQHGSHMNMCIRKKISLQSIYVYILIEKFKQKEVRAAKAAKVEKEEKKLADIELGGTKFNDINKIKSKAKVILNLTPDQNKLKEDHQKFVINKFILFMFR